MTIETVRIICASCGAAIAIPADLDQISCAHCGTPLTIVHGDGFVAARLARAVTRTIETSAAATQSELRRLQLQQERFALQGRIASLEAEERAIRRSQQGGGLLFSSPQLTAIERKWNQGVARLSVVEDALGLPRSYRAIPRQSLRSWPPRARTYGLAVLLLVVLCAAIGIFTGYDEVIWVGIMIGFIGYVAGGVFVLR